jgi:hypothetical protein
MALGASDFASSGDTHAYFLRPVTLDGGEGTDQTLATFVVPPVITNVP